MDCSENGVILDTVMAETKLEKSKMRYSAACRTDAPDKALLLEGSLAARQLECPVRGRARA